MAQENEQNHSLDPATAPVKRKRGRPRKEEVSGPDSGGRTQRRRRNVIENSGQNLVGQAVSGILDGVFDSGFLISVRVGNGGPLLRGMVFDSRLAVPISAANDIAPHIKMSKRDIPISPVPPSISPLQRRGASSVHTPTPNRVVVSDGGQGSTLKPEGSGGVVSSTLVTAQVSDNQGKVLTGTNQIHQGVEAAGEPKLDLTSQKPTGNATVSQRTPGLWLDLTSQKPTSNKIVSEPTSELTIQKPSVNEAASEVKLDSTSEQSLGKETVGEPKLGPANHQSPSNETVDEQTLEPTTKQSLRNETISEPKPDSTVQKSPGKEIVSEPKLDTTIQKSADNETLTELKSDSTIQTSPDMFYETVSELKPGSPRQESPGNDAAGELKPDSSKQKSPDQPQSSAAAVPDAISEVLEETKMNPIGDDSNQFASSRTVLR